MTLRSYIMAQPEDMRLDVALLVIEQIVGGGDAEIAGYMQAFGLARFEARVLAMLNTRAPAAVARWSLYSMLYGLEAERSEKTLDVLVGRIRSKLAKTDWRIHTVRGIGWSLSHRIPADIHALPSAMVPERWRKPWSADDDAELLRMRDCGSDWWAIAEEMGRTTRGCRQRYGGLRGVAA